MKTKPKSLKEIHKEEKLRKFLLASILALSLILRIFRLDSIPPGLSPDEASLGYNAYSILKTGKDEYGEFLPIIFKSFGDYKPGLYVYFTIPFVLVFGLNEFSVRLASSLSGVIAVFLIYKIISLLGRDEKFNFSSYFGELSAFLLAVNPWHIYFSRGAWEANLSLTLTLAGILFFLKALEKPKNLIISSFFFSLTLLCYQGAKLSTPLVMFALLYVFWRKLVYQTLANFKILVVAFSIGLLLALPIILSFRDEKVGRLSIFSVFSYPRPEKYLQEFLDQASEKVGGLTYYLFHSEALNFARGIMGRFFNHFSGRFLFFEGDWQNPRHSPPNHGMLFLFDMVLIPLGLFNLLKNKLKLSSFFLIFLILSPLPSALSRDQVHAVRSLNMVIPLVVLSSAGAVKLFEILKYNTNLSLTGTEKKTFLGTKIKIGVISFIFLVNFFYFLDAYFIHLPHRNEQIKFWGYKLIVESLVPIMDRYEKIKIQQSFDQPYIYFLFYEKYDPIKYQKQAKLVESEYKGDVGYVEQIDNVCFCAIDWPQNKKEKGTLIVADSIRIPQSELSDSSVHLIREIKSSNTVLFRIVEIE